MGGAGETESGTKLGTIPKNPVIEAPDYVTVNLRYHKNGTITTGTSSTGDRVVFDLSSVYRPNFTSADHQPMGMDKYEALYDYYKVIGTNYKIWCRRHDASYSQRSAVVTLVSSSPTQGDTGNMSNSVENKYRRDYAILTKYDDPWVILTGKTDIEHDRSNIINENDVPYWTAVGASPASGDGIYLVINHNVIDSATAKILDYSIEITYTVQFRQLDSTWVSESSY